MTTTTSMAIAAVFSVSLAAPALAAEDVTEHETYAERPEEADANLVRAVIGDECELSKRRSNS